MEEGTFTEWLKQEGEWVKAGDMLFVLEGDKAAEEIESFDAGILRIPGDAPQPGEQVVVGQLLAYLVAEGEPAPFEVPTNQVTQTSGRVHLESETPKSSTPNRTRVTRPTEDSNVAITPRARRAARELGIDWTGLLGTGRKGRIRERDVRGLGEARSTIGAKPIAATNALEGQVVPISRIRRTIADRMLAGVQQAAPVTLTTKADASNLVELRSQLQREVTAASEAIPSYTDLILKLAAVALGKYPQLKSQWQDDGIFIPDPTSIAFAVDTPAGLLAPVIRDVPDKTIWQVAAESRRLIELARQRQLHADQLQGATFTVTNLGSFGIDAFTPIIHLPQSAILGVGRINREPVVIEGDAIVPREMMSLSLTFDHRVLDGALAARFLNSLRQCISDPRWCLADGGE